MNDLVNILKKNNLLDKIDYDSLVNKKHLIIKDQNIDDIIRIIKIAIDVGFENKISLYNKNISVSGNELYDILQVICKNRHSKLHIGNIKFKNVEYNNNSLYINSNKDIKLYNKSFIDSLYEIINLLDRKNSVYKISKKEDIIYYKNYNEIYVSATTPDLLSVITNDKNLKDETSLINNMITNLMYSIYAIPRDFRESLNIPDKELVTKLLAAINKINSNIDHGDLHNFVRLSIRQDDFGAAINVDSIPIIRYDIGYKDNDSSIRNNLNIFLDSSKVINSLSINSNSTNIFEIDDFSKKAVNIMDITNNTLSKIKVYGNNILPYTIVNINNENSINYRSKNNCEVTSLGNSDTNKMLLSNILYYGVKTGNINKILYYIEFDTENNDNFVEMVPNKKTYRLLFHGNFSNKVNKIINFYNVLHNYSNKRIHMDKHGFINQIAENLINLVC